LLAAAPAVADTTSPNVSISAPSSGALYQRNATASSSFECMPDANGYSASSCTDQSGNSSGGPLDTSTPGPHTFVVTAQYDDGSTASSSVTYTVAAPPVVWLPLPTKRAVYAQGQALNSWYLCTDGTGGPGLTSCADQNAQGSGAPIDTSTLGSHTFTVTATSQDGQTSSNSVTYRVVPAPVVSHVVAHRGGVVTLEVTVYSPGTVDVLSTAAFRSFALSADTLAADVVHPPNGSFVFGSAHLVAYHQQTLQVRVPLSQAGELLLRDHAHATLQLLVLYSGYRGQPDLVKSLVLQIRR
jgi:hypothetical protein